MLEIALKPASHRDDEKQPQTFGALCVYSADPSRADIQWECGTSSFLGAFKSIQRAISVIEIPGLAPNVRNLATPAISTETFDADLRMFLAPDRVYHLEVKRYDFERWNQKTLNALRQATSQAFICDYNYYVEPKSSRQAACSQIDLETTAASTLYRDDILLHTFDAENWWKRSAFEKLTSWLTGRYIWRTSDENGFAWDEVVGNLDSLSRRERLSLWGQVVRDILNEPAYLVSPQAIGQRVARTFVQRLAQAPAVCRHCYEGRPHGRGPCTIRERVLTFDLMTGVSPPEMTAPTATGCSQHHFQEIGENRAQVLATPRKGAVSNRGMQGRPQCGGASRTLCFRFARQSEVAYRRHRVLQKFAAHESEGHRSAAVYGPYPGRLLDHISVG